MTPEDAGRLLAWMDCAWPDHPTDDLAAEFWIGQLIRQNVDVAGPALERLAKHQRRWPSVAVWQEACRTELHYRRETHRALEGPRISAEQGKALVGRLRDVMARRP